MPIIVTYLNPNMRPDVIEGENWKQIDGNSPGLGTINLKSLGDGHRIIVNKSAVAKVEEIPQDVWDKNVEAQKKAQEEQAKAKAAEEKKHRDAHEVATKKREADAAATLRGRVKRLFGRKG